MNSHPENQHNQEDNSRKPLISAEEFQQEVRDNIIELEKHKGLFLYMPANKWIEEASKRPIPKMLFSEFWFESELCILFADTNLGKSILAVQIGNSISKGHRIPGFQLQAEKQKVLYFDFELSDKQFENRYSENFQNPYRFDENFIRIEIDPESEPPEAVTFEDFLSESFEKCIIESGAKVLIIDNLTYLKNENEKARDALQLMKHLKALKKKYGLSLLVLAHTPKRDLTKPITNNDLQGSKMLINFCDSAFAIGESHQDKSLRYLKQIKQRNTEQLYDAENVCICQIIKPSNFLGFEFLYFGSEFEQLKRITAEVRDIQVIQIREMIAGGKSQREIARELGVSVSTVNKYANG